MLNCSNHKLTCLNDAWPLKNNTANVGGTYVDLLSITTSWSRDLPSLK